MSKKVPLNILQALQNQQWLIVPSAMQTILDIVYRENAESKLEALLAREGEPLEHTHTVINRNGTAIIPIIGPIFPRANLFTAHSGATDLETVAKDFVAALEDDEVHSIMFDIDSPGGSVTGLSDFSDLVFNSRGKKPIISFGSGMIASAAFFIGSAADKVIISRDAIIGAIGSIVNITDFSGMDKKLGIKELRFTSKVSPKKNLPFTSKAGAEQIQNLVDTLGEVFVSAVARNRGVSNETVLNDFGQGGVFVGQEAVDAGMVDSIATQEETLTRLNATAEEEPPKPTFVIPITNNKQTANLNPGGDLMDPKLIAKLTVDDLQSHNPDLLKSIKASVDTKTIESEAKAEGVKDGIKSENERIKAIEGIKNDANAKIVDDIKFDSSIDAGQAALKVLETQNSVNKGKGKDLLADGEELGNDASDLEDPPDSSEQASQEKHKTTVSGIVAGANNSRPVNHRSLDKVNI